jgi:hypothetical protein
MLALVQHVVQNEQLDLVARHHAGGKRLLFAVQLDFIFAQRLVQAAGAEGRELLHQVVVQPGGREAFHFDDLHRQTSCVVRKNAEIPRCAGNLSLYCTVYCTVSGGQMSSAARGDRGC